jgi:hypothetical protein
MKKRLGQIPSPHYNFGLEDRLKIHRSLAALLRHVYTTISATTMGVRSNTSKTRLCMKFCKNLISYPFTGWKGQNGDEKTVQRKKSYKGLFQKLRNNRHHALTRVEYDFAFGPMRFDDETWHDRGQHYSNCKSKWHSKALNDARRCVSWNGYCKRNGIKAMSLDGDQTSVWQPKSMSPAVLAEWEMQQASIETERLCLRNCLF